MKSGRPQPRSAPRSTGGSMPEISSRLPLDARLSSFDPDRSRDAAGASPETAFADLLRQMAGLAMDASAPKDAAPAPPLLSAPAGLGAKADLVRDLQLPRASL